MTTQSLNVLALKPGVGQYLAIHATLAARDFFLTYFYPSGPVTCIFSKSSPEDQVSFLLKIGENEMVGKCAGSKKDTEVKTLRNGSRPGSRS